MGELSSARAASAALKAEASEERAQVSRSFFKTGPGQYGEGDRFLGVTVPATRAVAKRAHALGEPELEKLLASPWHEERLLALLVLVRRYERAQEQEKQAVCAFYRRHFAAVNNWDLVDLSAWQILGRELRVHARGDTVPRELLTLADSSVLWERRIAMVSTFAWIKEGQARPALVLAARLLGDREDLMHKAVGWMLREVGKRASRAELEGFLEEHAHEMPRTALRYALEHFDAEARTHWLARKRSALRTGS